MLLGPTFVPFLRKLNEFFIFYAGGKVEKKVLDMAQRVDYNVWRRSLRTNSCVSTTWAVTKVAKWD
jgi:hypothetical protein